MKTLEKHVGQPGHETQGRIELTAKIEPFDTFWEGPEDVEGILLLIKFYKKLFEIRSSGSAVSNPGCQLWTGLLCQFARANRLF
jgi:hypothetical protein